MKLDQFIADHGQKEGGGAFQLENTKLLELKVDGAVWAKAGSMVAYRGSLQFKRNSGGAKKWLKKALTGEGAQTMRVEGRGMLYVADQGKTVHVLDLAAGEAVSVNGNDLLAFQDSVTWDVKMMKRAAGLMGGGLFNVRLEGPGLIAFTTHGTPIALRTPVITDPQATVAWSAHLSPDLKTDMSLGTLLGRSSGETFQMNFQAEGGVVIVQPFEEGGAAPTA